MVPDRLLTAAEDLLDAGQAAGAVRPDVQPFDLLRLGHGLAIASEFGTERTPNACWTSCWPAYAPTAVTRPPPAVDMHAPTVDSPTRANNSPPHSQLRTWMVNTPARGDDSHSRAADSPTQTVDSPARAVDSPCSTDSSE